MTPNSGVATFRITDPVRKQNSFSASITKAIHFGSSTRYGKFEEEEDKCREQQDADDDVFDDTAAAVEESPRISTTSRMANRDSATRVPSFDDSVKSETASANNLQGLLVRLSVDSCDAAVEVDNGSDRGDDDVNVREEEQEVQRLCDDCAPGESPSDVEEDEDAVASCASSARSSADVEFSFHNHGAAKTLHSGGLPSSGGHPSANTSTEEDDEEDDCTATTRPCPFEELREIISAPEYSDFHPFLNMDEQEAAIASHRSQALYEFCNTMTAKAAVSTDDLAVSSKILLHEAHRLHKIRLRAKQGTGHFGGLPLLPPHLRGATQTNSSSNHRVMDVKECDTMWQRVAHNSARDLYVEGHAFVQRRLSCMCIFSATKDDRHYHDNDGERMTRLVRQERLLMQIQQQALSGGNAHFLEPTDVVQIPW